MRAHVRVLRLAVALVATCGCTLPASVPSEHDVKGAYVLNILRLSERKQVSSSAAPEIVLCLLSPGPLAQPLQRLQGTVVRGKPVSVRTVQKGSIRGCDVLYVGRTVGLESVVRDAFDAGMLTIGSDDEFMNASGGVALVVDGRRIAIVVNDALVKQGRWAFSSHLLEIARIAPRGVR